MRTLGLDVGTKTIGVAVSDPLGWTAQGLTTLYRKSWEQDLTALAEIVAQQEVETVVVGLPLHMNGSEGESAQRARELGEAIRERLGVQVVYQDERLSTAAAQRVLLAGDVSRANRKKVIDKLAAAYILQGYLDGPAQRR